MEALLKYIQRDLSELEGGTGVELKKYLFTNTAVSASAFAEDTTYEDYPYKAAVALDGVMESMIPEIMFGMADATGGYFAPVAETYNGGIYLYAVDIPENDVVIPTIICWRGSV